MVILVLGILVNQVILIFLRTRIVKLIFSTREIMILAELGSSRKERCYGGMENLYKMKKIFIDRV